MQPHTLRWHTSSTGTRCPTFLAVPCIALICFQELYDSIPAKRAHTLSRKRSLAAHAHTLARSLSHTHTLASALSQALRASARSLRVSFLSPLAGAEAAGEKLDQKAAQTLKRLLLSTACEPSVRMFRVPNAKLWAATVGSRSRGCMSEPYLFCPECSWGNFRICR